MTRGTSFGDSWWAKRWLGVLDSFSWKSRLQRGRAYARSGRVERVTVHTGMVVAFVMGQQTKPYQVTIKLTPFAVSDWEQIIDRLLDRPVLVAKLLAGEMPREMDEVFSALHLNLFPKSAKDLQTNCTCPDWANPCKHIAAVYYMLGHTFNEDPFSLLTLRGMSKQEMLSRLHTRWMKSEDVSIEEFDENSFWSMAADLHDVPIHLSHTGVSPRTLPMVWGPPHFMEELSPKGTREMVGLFADVLQHASQRAASLILVGKWYN